MIHEKRRSTATHPRAIPIDADGPVPQELESGFRTTVTAYFGTCK